MDQFKTIIESIVDGILVQDREFRCVYANTAGARMCGYPSAAAFQNAPMTEALSRFELRDELGQPFPLDRLPARRVLNGEAEPPETVMRSRNLATGAETWAAVTARPIYGEDGKTRFAVSIFRDITRQRRAEEASKLREERLKLAAALTGIGTWDRDLITGHMVNDEVFRAHLGFRQDEPCDSLQVLRSKCHPEDLGPAVEKFEAAIRTGSEYSAEYRTPRPDGEVHWIAVKGRALYNELGVPYRMLGISLDITERRNAEERLREAEARARFLSEAAAFLSGEREAQETLQGLARLAVPRLADWCIVETTEEDGSRHMAMAHSDPEKLVLSEELRRRIPPDWNASQGVARVIRTGKPKLVQEIPAESFQALHPELRQICHELGLRSAMVVPLAVSQRVFGAITLISAESGRKFDENDLALALELAQRAALVIENSRLAAKMGPA